jgi:teichoic acid transport system permease protein
MAVAPARRAPRSNAHGLRASLRRLCERRETIRYLVSSQLRAGHRDKVLGNLWNLLDPMLFVGVYFVVFGLLFQQRAPGRTTEFILYLSIGVLAWRFHGASISQGANCIRGNRGLVHEISFPKAVFPIAICLSRLYDFLWGLLIVAVLTLVIGSGVTIHWLCVAAAARLAPAAVHDRGHVHRRVSRRLLRRHREHRRRGDAIVVLYVADLLQGPR